ncbi:MAG: hypothetical protein J6S63_11025 [Atopobiaceae bacterium]|nr:hypothetical protein [Atopobiaceae bacterium]
MAISSDMLAEEARMERSSRRNVAFLVESMFVLALLMASTAIFVQIFSSAQLEGRDANRLSHAVVAATNYAEEFSANPSATPASVTEEDLQITCDVDVITYKGGKLYDATINVAYSGEHVYTLHTARYVHTPGGDKS